MNPSFFTRRITISSTKSVNDFQTFELHLGKHGARCVGASIFAEYDNGSAKQLEFSLEVRENGKLRMPLNRLRQEHFNFTKKVGLNDRFLRFDPFETSEPALLYVRSIADTTLTSENTSQTIKVVLLLEGEPAKTLTHE